MLATFRKLQKDEHGQAIIIAAVGLLIMAIGVLATAQIGFAIFEKQKLQTIADANAYSLATMQARMFNFFAFTNRAMVVHYVAMMHMQGIVSELTLLESLAGAASDYLHDSFCILCPCPYMSWACPLCHPAYEIAEGARVGFTQAVDALDKVAYSATMALQGVNAAYSGAQRAMQGAMYVINGTGMLQVSYEADPDIDLGVSKLVSGIINEVVWADLFDSGSIALPGNSTENLKAQRVITEIANATRHPPETTSAHDPASFGVPIGGFSMLKGQTKLISNQNYKNIEKQTFYDSKLAEGRAMSSIDYAEGFGMGGSALGMDPVGIEHVKSGGIHYRYHRYRQPYEPPPTTCASASRNPWGKVDETNDPWHKDWNSPSSYIALKPDNVKNPDKDFGQHGVFVWLNKKTAKLEREGLTQKFRMHAPHYTTKLDTNIGKDGVLTSGAFTGINAIAAAQVYYHRPGNWTEQPNLFNPFWKARLYPTAEFINKWLMGSSLPPEIGSLLQNWLLIH